MNDERWFPRFAEIPGIKYDAPPNLDFSALPGRDKIPRIEYYNFDGKRHVSLDWKSGDITTSASPAHEWKTLPRAGESQAATILRQVYETLELPGILSDYHFAIQHAHEALRKYVGKEIWAPAYIEKLCLLDVQLLDKYPETIVFESIKDEIHYARASAFARLIDLYEKEGYLRDALQIAKIAERLEQGTGIFQELEERISLMETEDNYV
jgi:hypothetical protein